MAERTVAVVTLENLAGGAPAELFQSELAKVLRNIADPNTEPEAVRKIVLEVVFTPSEDREAGDVKIRCNAKLAGGRGVQTRVFFGRHAGELVAAESNPKQQGLFDEKPVLRSITKDK